jgi:hypothetical protein
MTQRVPPRPRFAICRARSRAFFRVAPICGNLSLGGHWLFPDLPKFADNDFVGGFVSSLRSFHPASVELSVKDDTLRLPAGFPSFEAINCFLTFYVSPSEFHVGIYRHSSASAGVIM